MSTYIPKVTIQIETGCSTCHCALNVLPELGGCACGNAYAVVEDSTPNSPCVACEDACDEIWPSDCTLYGGADVPQLGIKKGDKLTKVLIVLFAEVIAAKARITTLGG